jgi:hypothetical protein
MEVANNTQRIHTCKDLAILHHCIILHVYFVAFTAYLAPEAGQLL